ncbi:MAG: hypothetical protein JWM02_1298 [Frankiales bacterium]|nr:hypothetical protein [Frankiales bacterium]
MSAPRYRRQSLSRPPRSRTDQGSSTLELVLLTPVLIALIFGLIQASLLWNARHLTDAAAQHGARLARTSVALQPVSDYAGPGTDPAVDQAVRDSTLSYLQQTGGHALQNPTVQIQRTGDFVTVTVSGTAVGVLPGTTVHVTSHSRTPVEGFRP